MYNKIYILRKKNPASYLFISSDRLKLHALSGTCPMTNVTTINRSKIFLNRIICLKANRYEHTDIQEILYRTCIEREAAEYSEDLYEEINLGHKNVKEFLCFLSCEKDR